MTNRGTITLTGGNLRQAHISLRSVIDMFPEDAIGGTSKDDPGRPVRFFWGPDLQPTESDLPSDKLIIRDRSASRQFLKHYRLKENDVIIIERIGPRDYFIHPEHQL